MNGSTRRQVVVIATQHSHTHTLTSRLKSIAQLAQDPRRECGFDGQREGERKWAWPGLQSRNLAHSQVQTLALSASVPYCGSIEYQSPWRRVFKVEVESRLGPFVVYNLCL